MKANSLSLFLFLFLTLSAYSKNIINSTNNSNLIFSDYQNDKFCLCLQGTANANRVVIYYVFRDSLINAKNKYFEDVTSDFLNQGIYVEVINIESGKIEFNKRTFASPFLDEFKIIDSLISYKPISKYYQIDILHHDDTLYFKRDSILNLLTGITSDLNLSIRFYYRGGDLDLICKNEIKTKDYIVERTELGKIKFNRKPMNLYPSQNYEFKIHKEISSLTLFAIEHNSNLFVSKSTIKEFGSFSLLYALNGFVPMFKNTYLPIGYALSYQNIRLTNQPEYFSIDLANYTRRRIRLYSIQLQSGITRTFGKSEKTFLQILLWGNYTPITKYAIWDQNDEKKIIKNDDFISRFNYGLKFQFGYEAGSIYFNYRINNLFKQSYNLPDLAVFSLGLELQGVLNGGTYRPNSFK